MDITSIGGQIGTIAVLVIFVFMEGGNPLDLVSHPAPLFLIIMGSIIAVIYQTPLAIAVKIPQYVIKIFTETQYDFLGSIELIGRMADRARREGLLALEEDTKDINDDFMQKGIMMVVDGVDPHQIRAILEVNIHQMEARHKKAYSLFADAGGFSPTIGIMGTVSGLINVLKELSDPDKLAKSIASAFLATLWGLLMANFFFLPMGAKLKNKSNIEASYRNMIMEGILSIQAGENPRVIKDKLISYVPPKEAAKAEGGEGARAGAEA